MSNIHVLLLVQDCGEPSQINDGAFICDLGYIYGSVCTYTCGLGYVLASNDTVECLDNGSWSYGSTTSGCNGRSTTVS